MCYVDAKGDDTVHESVKEEHPTLSPEMGKLWSIILIHFCPIGNIKHWFDTFLGPEYPKPAGVLTTYKIVGDNIDKDVKPRHMRSDYQRKSLH